MGNKRRVVYEMPKHLLEQIQQRASVYGRTRNAEGRYLVALGLSFAGEEDMQIELPGRDKVEWVQVSGNLDREVYLVVEARARRFHRSVGMEIVRTMIFGIEETVNRDLELISQMMARSAS